VPPDLERRRFGEIVEATPLVSIDLLVTDGDGALLVGLRTNEPARGFFFVPGGRIRKGETLPEALRRIAEFELALDVSWHSDDVAGVFTHIYPTNAVGLRGVTTHYVVIAYRVRVADGLDLDDLRAHSPQHSEYRWITLADVESGELPVHENTAEYLRLGVTEPRR
jgi:colanic acid biosynthesis protein WcaH